MNSPSLVKMTKSTVAAPENGNRFSAPGDYTLITWRKSRAKLSFELSQGERVLECSMDAVIENELRVILAIYGLSVDFRESYAKREPRK